MTISFADRIARVTARMTSEDEAAIRADAETIERAGITSVEQLVDAVSDTDQELTIRAIACHLVALVNERSAAPALAHILADGAADLTWVAAKALITLHADDVAPTMVRVLAHGPASRQSAAAYVLGWLRVATTAPALRAAALDPDLDADVRGHAAEALGVMAARDAVPALITLLSDASPEVRYWAACALGQIGDPASVPALERMAGTDVAVIPHGLSLKEEALDALATIRERDGERP